jgi:hypothetical protein
MFISVASGQNSTDYKQIDSVIHSYRAKGFITKKIKQEHLKIRYVYYKISGGVFAVQLMRFVYDSASIYTYFFLEDEVVKITVNITRRAGSIRGSGRYYFTHGELIRRTEKNINIRNYDQLLNEGKEYLTKAKQAN